MSRAFTSLLWLSVLYAACVSATVLTVPVIYDHLYGVAL